MAALQRSEQRTERREFRLAQRLAAKHQDAVLRIEAAQLRNSRVVRPLPNVEAGHFPSEARVELSRFEHELRPRGNWQGGQRN